MELSYDPAVPLLGIYIYPKELKARSWRDISIVIFIATLFTIAKRWKQPKCLLMDKAISQMWYIHTKEYYSLKNERNSDTCHTMDEPEDITLIEIRQSQKDKYCMIPLFIYLLIYFWLRWVFVAARRLSLHEAIRGYSSLWCAGFSLRSLLLWSTGSRHSGFSSCGTHAQ